MHTLADAACELLCVQAVYGVLKEAEHRSTFYLPYWKLPLASVVVPRQRKFSEDLGFPELVTSNTPWGQMFFKGTSASHVVLCRAAIALYKITESARRVSLLKDAEKM